MEFIETDLRGAFLVKPATFVDERGFFARTWSQREFEERGLDGTLVECNVSFNSHSGTLRGMHYQSEPNAQVKLVRCTQGAIHDVIIDLRRDSPTFRRWIAARLSADNHLMLYVPAGFAHGFQTLQENTEVLYQMGAYYAPENAHGVRWNDPAFAIEWPDEERIINTRDATYPDFAPMKRVLVTGASGFVGSQCIPLLEDEAGEVHAVSTRPPRNAVGRVTWHGCDLMKDDEVESLFAAVRPTHLLHMAWYAVPQRFWAAVENVDWLRATLTIVQSFARHGGKRVVAAGSCAEYDWSSGLCSEASTPTQPTSLYGACKLATHLATDAYCRQIGISSAWGRIFFMYGPGEDPQRFVASIITSMMDGLPARCSDGNQVRDMLHVQDVARAFVALLGSDVRGAVNIGSGLSPRLADVARAIAAKMGRPDLLQLGAIPPRPNDPPSIVAETHRLSNEVRWSPAMSLDAGLEQAIAWWQSRPQKQSNRETHEAHP